MLMQPICRSFRSNACLGNVKQHNFDNDRLTQRVRERTHFRHETFIPTPCRLPWKALSRAAIIARRLFVHISTSVYSKVLIYIAD